MKNRALSAWRVGAFLRLGPKANAESPGPGGAKRADGRRPALRSYRGGWPFQNATIEPRWRVAGIALFQHRSRQIQSRRKGSHPEPDREGTPIVAKETRWLKGQAQPNGGHKGVRIGSAAGVDPILQIGLE